MNIENFSHCLTLKTLVFKIENKPCKDPSNNSGTCIKFKSCPRLLAMIEQKPLSPTNRQFLKASQCGFKDESAYVCCSDDLEIATTASPIIDEPKNETIKHTEWYKKLIKNFPSPSECGLDVQDRIFGGIQTEIDEYPWTVQLEFLKCQSVTLNQFLITS